VAIELANANMPAATAKYLMDVIPLVSKFWGVLGERINLAVCLRARIPLAHAVDSASIDKTRQTRYSLQQIICRFAGFLPEFAKVLAPKA
jgi:hypothetical protein